MLDIGCGPGTIIECLPEDVDYHGYDMEARYGARGKFAVKMVSKHTDDDNALFYVAIAIGVLHHLTDEECDALFAGAEKGLKPEGRLTTLDGVYRAGQNPVARLLLKMDRGRHVPTCEAYVELARKHFGSVETTILHDLIAVPYTQIIMEMKNSE